MKPSLLLLCCFLLFSCTAPESSVSPSKPNILFILVDDLGKEWVSSYGAEEIKTPHIDALAQSGMLFDNVYSMPQCTPSRVTLLTAQYPYQHGWVNHWDVPRWGAGAHFDETQNPVLVKELKKAGYKTCIAGKWQIDDFRVEPDALSRIGFDDWCMWTGYETGIPASGERYQNPYIFTRNGSRTYENQFGPDVFRDFLIQFIREHKDSAFFAYYPMVLPHGPLVNTPDQSADDNLGKFKAMVSYVDKITGQLVQALEEAQVRENTLIIWTTDNGSTRGMTGNLQGRKVKGGKGLSLESGINSPFIASWPKVIPPQSRSDALIDFTDILPTFLEVAGNQVGETVQGHTIHGKSFKGAFHADKSYQGREWILSMGGGNHARRTNQGVENQYAFRDRVVRNKRYKLCINAEQKASQFFDLLEDPGEEHNLLDHLDTPELRENFAQLSSLITSFPPKDHDPRYKANPPQSWDVEVSAESQIWKK